MTTQKHETPLSDAIETARRGLGARRTPAYGDTLALCRRLEAELAELKAKQPKEGRFYMLGGQLDEVVPGHVLLETRPVIWCHFEQKWIS